MPILLSLPCRELDDPVYSPPDKHTQPSTPEKGPASRPGAPPLPPRVSWRCSPSTVIVIRDIDHKYYDIRSACEKPTLPTLMDDAIRDYANMANCVELLCNDGGGGQGLICIASSPCCTSIERTMKLTRSSHL